MVFRDRTEAGRVLATQLTALGAARPVILALPRGGVPVAFEVARALDAPLDVLGVRKLGAPGQPELGVGALAEEGIGVLDPEMAARVGLTHADLDRVLEIESAELSRRVHAYRDDRPPTPLAGRTVIVIDDGLATGLTVLAAVRAVRRRGARQVIVAVPVGSPQAVALLRREADRVICAEMPAQLDGVGRWYEDFSQVTDREVIDLLAGAQRGAGRSETLAFELDGQQLAADLDVPAGARGLVVFAHGGGSKRSSPRNQAVARALHQAGLATLLFGLLSEREQDRRELAFDIPLLARRLKAVTEWVAGREDLAGLPLGYFGASTGAAAALHAAADVGEGVRAVVSRGGRPDLAGDRLHAVTAPTLLIVGGRDDEVLRLNELAATRLRCIHELVVVPGAGQLFEEPGAIDTVARLAGAWFARHLAGVPSTLAGA